MTIAFRPLGHKYYEKVIDMCLCIREQTDKANDCVDGVQHDTLHENYNQSRSQILQVYFQWHFIALKL